MSILDRLNLLIRSNINDTSSSSSSAWRDTVRDMESSLRDAKKQLAQLQGNERQLVAQIRESNAKADKWEERAILALKQDAEDLAKDAIIMKNQELREAGRLRDRLDEHRSYMRDMQSSLEALEVKIEGTRGRIEADRQRYSPSRPSSNASSPRAERDWDAEMRRRMQGNDTGAPSSTDGDTRRSGYASRSSSSPSPFDTDDTFSTFDRMSRRISEIEAHVDAEQELGSGGFISDDDLIDPRKRELNQIFDRMEKEKETNDDLSDLKKRFGSD